MLFIILYRWKSLEFMSYGTYKLHSIYINFTNCKQAQRLQINYYNSYKSINKIGYKKTNSITYAILN